MDVSIIIFSAPCQTNDQIKFSDALSKYITHISQSNFSKYFRNCSAKRAAASQDVNASDMHHFHLSTHKNAPNLQLVLRC